MGGNQDYYSRRTKNSRELSFLQNLTRLPRDAQCSKFFVQLLDHFVHEGPNGFQQCLVLEMLGPTIASDVIDSSTLGERMDTDDIFRISKQVIEAIAWMHEAGYAHGGMISRRSFWLLFGGWLNRI